MEPTKLFTIVSVIALLVISPGGAKPTPEENEDPTLEAYGETREGTIEETIDEGKCICVSISSKGNSFNHHLLCIYVCVSVCIIFLLLCFSFYE